MNLSKRLMMVAREAHKCGLLVDIGTDHAYIPIFLFKNGVIHKAVAADISVGSADKAKKNITEYKYDEFIDVRCGSGLSVIKETEKPDIIILSGMGGMLIIDILNNDIDVVLRSNKLILQPQRDIDKVRRYIHSIGFKIINENMIYENSKYYFAITCIQGNEEQYTDMEYLIGKILINKKFPLLKEYINYEKHKIETALNSINKNISENKIKYENLMEKCKTYEEALKCL